jgi:hypothetical protein
MLVILNGSQSSTPPALLSGYTNVLTEVNTSGNRAVRVQYKISDGSESSAAVSFYGGAYVLRNASSIVQSSSRVGTTSNNMVIPQLTNCSTSGTNLILAGSFIATLGTLTPPSGFQAATNGSTLQGAYIANNTNSSTPLGSTFTFTTSSADLTWILEVA